MLKMVFLTAMFLLCVSPVSARESITVIDGDTLRIGDKRIRLYGIDAPESKQPFGRTATAITAMLIEHGKNIELLAHNQDQYGRIVGTITIDGTSLQELLLKTGAAWFSSKYCTASVCSDWQKQSLKAQKARIGLWEYSNAVPPWKWRHSK